MEVIEHRTSQLHPCALTVGTLRALCAEAGGELAERKVRSVRAFPDDHEVICSRADIEALGGKVTVDARFAADPVEFVAADLRKLANDAPHPAADRLLRALRDVPDATVVLLDKPTAAALQQSIERRR